MGPVIFHTVWAIFMMIAFVDLIVWISSDKQKKLFDDAAQIPLEQDTRPDAATSSGETKDHE